MKNFRKSLTSKYLIVGIAFAVWMMFFDRNDLPSQLKRIRELNKLEGSEKLMDRQIKDTRFELSYLKTSPVTLEKYAREKYLMKKDNEDLFVIASDSASIR